jgi:hypothetical protein
MTQRRPYTKADEDRLRAEAAMPVLTREKGCYGRQGNCTEPPAYTWTGPHGGTYWLCVTCCAEWRGQVTGTGLEPQRIRDIRTGG